MKEPRQSKISSGSAAGLTGSGIRAFLKSPVAMLMLMIAAMQLSHQAWFTLLNNFAIDAIQFTGREIGILQSIREIPGFLAVGVIFVLLIIREQPLALIALACLGVGTALTGYFPSAIGFLCNDTPDVAGVSLL